MKIEIYKHSDDYDNPNDIAMTHHKELKYEVEIEDAEVITLIRRVLAKGVVMKE